MPDELAVRTGGGDLQPVECRQALGVPGDPSEPAAELLRALGIRPAPEGIRQLSDQVQSQLAQIRDNVFGDS